MCTKCNKQSIETMRKSFKLSIKKPKRDLKEFNKSIKKYCWNRIGNSATVELTVDLSNLVCMMSFRRISIEFTKTP